MFLVLSTLDAGGALVEKYSTAVDDGPIGKMICDDTTEFYLMLLNVFICMLIGVEA